MTLAELLERVEHRFPQARVAVSCTLLAPGLGESRTARAFAHVHASGATDVLTFSAVAQTPEDAIAAVGLQIEAFRAPELTETVEMPVVSMADLVSAGAWR